ncbi:MAG: hypothetical protein IM574_02145 [Cytophagales bacterium]|jgi:hypothetical protein|nr:hypothetical protein [Cytophagales bacterium]MCA6387297.1 hypothetical protein [Cytophagales bacterium]MCA6391733.1 hypothetical protein [Cytophagales bacterium]MCA6393966.1 hypothetical protein [Cytophagales bacterium]MCA6398900.1 hypothetical protein [Cytophagales bacterium]
MGRLKMNVGFLVFCTLAALVLHAQDDVPFMLADQFESKIDLAFKKRESSDAGTYTFSDGSQPKKTTDTPIAFLSINFTLLRAEGEVKVNVVNGRSERVSKVKVGSPMKLEVGFIEDVKNNGEGVEINLIFLNDLKKPIRKVTFKIAEDGSYFVNGEKRGKF